MKIANRFSIAVHILTLLEWLSNETASSEQMAGSIGVNPVIVRRTMVKLREAGLVSTRQGVAGAALAKPLKDISMLDVLKSVETEEGIFSVHQNPNPNCPIGANIQTALEEVYNTAQKAMERELEKVTLDKFVEDILTVTK